MRLIHGGKRKGKIRKDGIKITKRETKQNWRGQKGRGNRGSSAGDRGSQWGSYLPCYFYEAYAQSLCQVSRDQGSGEGSGRSQGRRWEEGGEVKAQGDEMERGRGKVEKDREGKR